MIEVIRSLVRSRRFKIPDMSKQDYPPESNMAMKHLPIVDDFLIQTSIYIRLSIATQKWDNLASSTVERILDLPQAL